MWDFGQPYSSRPIYVGIVRLGTYELPSKFYFYLKRLINILNENEQKQNLCRFLRWCAVLSCVFRNLSATQVRCYQVTMLDHTYLDIFFLKYLHIFLKYLLKPPLVYLHFDRDLHTFASTLAIHLCMRCRVEELKERQGDRPMAHKSMWRNMDSEIKRGRAEDEKNP